MACFVRKLHDLVFNRRAVAWANSLDTSRIKRGAMKVFANDFVSGLIRGSEMTRNLILRKLSSVKGKWLWGIVALLLFEAFPTNALVEQARRGSGFKANESDPVLT